MRHLSLPWRLRLVEPTSAVDEVLAWVRTRPDWQQDAFRRLTVQGELTQTDKLEVWRMAKKWAGLPVDVDPPLPIPLRATDFQVGGGGTSLLQLAALKALKGVNALAEGQELQFGTTGMTVVYGENGAGKSGYFRVMKHACHAKGVEPILGDVRRQDPPKQEAVFEILDAAGTKRGVKWVGDSPLEELSQFSLFDSACARIILGTASDPVFLPAGLGAFGPFTEVLDGVHGRLTKEAEALEDIRSLDAILEALRGDHEVGRMIATFPSGATKAALDALAVFGKDQTEELEGLEAQLKELAAADPSIAISRLTALRSRAHREHQKFELFRDRFKKDAIRNILEKWATWKAAVEARAVAGALQSKDDPLPGVGSRTWQTLFQAAERFSVEEAYKGRGFPVTGSGAHCVLCMQTMDDAASDRLKRFHAFIQDKTAQQAEAAELAWQTISAPLASARLDSLDPVFLDDLPQDFPELPARLQEAGDRLRKAWSRAWESCQSGRDPGDLDTADDVVSELVRVYEVLGGRLEALATAKKDSAVADLTRKKAALIARANLTKHKAALHDALDKKAKAGSIRALLPTLITTSVTTTQKGLAKKAIEGRYGQALKAEMEALGLDRFKLAYKSVASKGEVTQLLHLPDASSGIKPEQVLSEGERKVAALAAFLAEVSLLPQKSAIILDDPISSLDHVWTERVAERLVEKAKEHQVIVFTHHLDFVHLLRDHAYFADPKVPFKPLAVDWTPDNPGVVTEGTPWFAAGVRDSITALDADLAELERLYVANPASEDYKLRRSRFVDRLRTTWERLVEEDLLNGVVKRFDHRIPTQRLNAVLVEDGDYQAVFNGMAKASKQTEAHSHGRQSLSVAATPKELRQALEELRTYRGTVTKRHEALSKKRNALTTPG